jgi:hypothetical protein
LLELVAPPAGKGEVSVAVNQSGCHQPAPGVESLSATVFRGELLLAAYPLNQSLIPDHGGLRDDVNVTLLALGPAGRKLCDVSKHLHEMWLLTYFTTKAQRSRRSRRANPDLDSRLY